MSPTDIPKALEKFGQIDGALARRYEGTGLGLPLAKSQMELHGGSLRIISQLNIGTTVRVHFPAERTVAALPLDPRPLGSMARPAHRC